MTLLLAAAILAGGLKVHALAGANRALKRQNASCVAMSHQIRDGIALAQAAAASVGSPAPSFTLLELDGDALQMSSSVAGRVHVLFADPSHRHFGRALPAYRKTYPTDREVRKVLVTISGPERVRDVLTKAPEGWEVGVHGAEVYRAYGFLGAPGVAVVEGGLLRERRALALAPDELPLS